LYAHSATYLQACVVWQFWRTIRGNVNGSLIPFSCAQEERELKKHPTHVHVHSLDCSA
jgi:hypothetical protein